MKILITGGAGFIGSHLALQLADEEVVVLDDFSSGSRENLEGFSGEIIEGSILDEDCVVGALEGVDLIFHLAAYTSAPGSMENPGNCAELNVQGLLTVLNAARVSRCGRVIFASSAAVYGNGPELPKVETLPPSPESPYALTKLDGEYYLRLLGEAWGISSASVRFFNVFGPRQNADSGYAAAVPNFCKQALAGEDLMIHGDGEQTRDFIYVEDLVEALRHVGRSESCVGLYNAGYGESLTINSLAEQIIELSGSSSKIVRSGERPGDVRHSLANVDRLLGRGWRPTVGFQEGLARTVNYYASNAGPDHEGMGGQI